jgi:hypothetical protein
MDFITNTIASVTGIWKKIASVLPLIAGAGGVLVGSGSILIQISHSGSASAALHIIQSLNQNDPNVMMIAGGLLALGIHTNHQENKASIADQKDAPKDS